jgi:hypothetical protein
VYGREFLFLSLNADVDAWLGYTESGDAILVQEVGERCHRKHQGSFRGAEFYTAADAFDGRKLVESSRHAPALPMNREISGPSAVYAAAFARDKRPGGPFMARQACLAGTYQRCAAAFILSCRNVG